MSLPMINREWLQLIPLVIQLTMIPLSSCRQEIREETFFKLQKMARDLELKLANMEFMLMVLDFSLILIQITPT
jgi:hypothetical protein